MSNQTQPKGPGVKSGNIGRARRLLLLVVAALVMAVAASPASASRTASTSGAYINGTGWYYRGLQDYVYVKDTAADGHCAYASVKLALSGYNDVFKNDHVVCGSGTGKTFDHRGIFAHTGPILSSYSSSAIQGVYMRACIDNHTWPIADTCGGYVYVGDYGSSSAQ